MAFSTRAIEELLKIKKAFDELRKLMDGEDILFYVETVNPNTDRDWDPTPLTFRYLVAESGSGYEDKIVLFEDEMIFTDDSDHKPILDYVTMFLQARAKQAETDANPNDTEH